MSVANTGSQTIRVVTWNCRGASLGSGLWDYLLELDPDVAVLQDFRTVPDRVLQVYLHARNAAVPTPARAPRNFTGILVKGVSTRVIHLPAPNDWVARELENWREFFTARALTLQGGAKLTVLSVYSPAFPIDRARLSGIDTTGVRLTQNPNVWGTELLWASLKAMNVNATDRLIVAGDLNSSETLDSPKPRGNREFMERMHSLGLTECLRTFTGQLTPTFRTPRAGTFTLQRRFVNI
jgi:hypothetical protein